MSKLSLISPNEQGVLMEAGDRIPLSLAYVGAAARRAGHEVQIYDLNHMDYYTLHKKINEFNPTYIGMTTTTPYYNWITNFTTFLRSKYPTKTLIAGGPHATVDPESLKPYFDYIVQGEGENAIVDILNKYVIKNIIRNPYTENLDELAKPAWDLFPLDERYGINQEGQRTMTISGSRSCNNNCFFCTKNILGPKTRFHSPERIIEEIKELKNKYGFKSFYFVDDCFSINRERTMDLAEKLIKENLGISYRAVTRTDKVDYELLKKLKESGLRTISYGVEHMNDEVLKRIQKGNTVENNLNAVRMAKDLGLIVRTSMIMNLPGATKETMYECLDFAMKENVDYADIYALIAYPGTQLWNESKKYGMKLISKDYNFYQTGWQTNVEMDTIPNDELHKIMNDIRKKWKEFKGTQTPWIKK